MPQPSTTARRYAEAIFELGDDAGSLDQWADDLDVLANVAGDGGALGVLENIKTPMEDRVALLDRALAGMSPLARNLAKLLVSRGRLGLVTQIRDVFRETLDERRNVARAELTSAVPLSEEEREAAVRRIKSLTGSSDVRLVTKVDPAIIGGLIIRVGDRLIDGSTRARLTQLRRRLAGVAP